jgi:hypothetical protein
VHWEDLTNSRWRLISTSQVYTAEQRTERGLCQSTRCTQAVELVGDSTNDASGHDDVLFGRSCAVLSSYLPTSSLTRCTALPPFAVL